MSPQGLVTAAGSADSSAMVQHSFETWDAAARPWVVPGR